ncbi:MAG: hypothetical protein ACHP65_03815 [Legionellales bacterium]
MIAVGGEQEAPKLNYYRTLTASGRDSLRLIIESGALQDRVFLLPDFLCDVVTKTLHEYQIQCRYYTVAADLSFELGPMHDNEVVYVVNYFGQQHPGIMATLKNHTVIVDDVFSPFPQIVTAVASWYSFNSLRKISPLVDGSLLYSSHPLSEQRIQLAVGSDFTQQKARAKHKKFDFIHHGTGCEEDYLTLFVAAETLLNNRQSILSMSIASQLAFAEFCVTLAYERQIRQQNYDLICQLLPEKIMPIHSDFYSFAPLLLNNRDAIKQHLMAQRVFLPVHWPGPSVLSQRILSIPVDSRYSSQELTVICNLISPP